MLCDLSTRRQRAPVELAQRRVRCSGGTAAFNGASSARLITAGDGAGRGTSRCRRPIRDDDPRVIAATSDCAHRHDNERTNEPRPPDRVQQQQQPRRRRRGTAPYCMTSFTVACPLASSHAPAPANRGGEFEFAHGNRLHLQTGAAAARSVHVVQDNTGIGRKFRADDMPPSSSTESVAASSVCNKELFK